MTVSKINILNFKNSIRLSTSIAREDSIKAPNCVSVNMDILFGKYNHNYKYYVCCISHVYVRHQIKIRPNKLVCNFSIQHKHIILLGFVNILISAPQKDSERDFWSSVLKVNIKITANIRMKWVQRAMMQRRQGNITCFCLNKRVRRKRGKRMWAIE